VSASRSGSGGGRVPDADPGFAPIAVVEVELSAPLPAIASTDADGLRYGSARLIVRLHTKTVGVVDVDLPEDGLAPAACAHAIWSALGPAINEHLRVDLLPETTVLDERGLTPADSPPCVRSREAILRDAPSASVIVCTRNRPELIARTLSSLEALEYPDYEVLVIDGSQGPETADVVRGRFPGVRYLHVGAQRKCFALNRGIAAARGSIVGFTDDDVRVDKHWLAELASRFSDPRVGCVTGIAFPMELRTQAQVWFEESGGFTDGFAPRTIGLDMPAEPGSLLPFATGKIGAGVNMAWRRDVLLEIEGFDLTLDTITPVWPLGADHSTAGEDLAAFFDALVQGHRLAFEPSAIVFHEHRRTYDEFARQIYWHGIGLTAYLTRCLLRRPAQIPGFLARVPRGLAYGFGESSVRNDQKSGSFPPEVTRAEWRGVVHGPFAYLRGLPKGRRLRAGSRGGDG
jgi:glycosyltransferase involved in cell wall biosynthesis